MFDCFVSSTSSNNLKAVFIFRLDCYVREGHKKANHETVNTKCTVKRSRRIKQGARHRIYKYISLSQYKYIRFCYVCVAVFDIKLSGFSVSKGAGLSTCYTSITLVIPVSQTAETEICFWVKKKIKKSFPQLLEWILKCYSSFSYAPGIIRSWTPPGFYYNSCLRPRVSATGALGCLIFIH